LQLIPSKDDVSGTCAMLCAVFRPPRQIRWFVGLQAVSLAFGVLVVFMVWKGLGEKVALFHLISVIAVYLAIQIFFIWKVWIGKNWARLTMLTSFLWSCIQALVWRVPLPSGVHLSRSMKAIGILLTILQACSFVPLFINPANEWFRRAPHKESLPSP
jgi:hypothetical protein